VEITDATFEFAEGDAFTAEAEDVTAKIGAEDLIKEQNKLVVFKGMTIEAQEDGSAFTYKDAEGKTDDLYFKASKDGTTVDFCVEFYLCGKDTDVYKAVEGLKVGDVVDITAYLYWYNGANPPVIAVAAGEADCVIISNYRYSNISKLCEKLHLATVYTGVDMDYCFALNKGNTTLYSILTKVNNAVPDAVIHTALTYYSTEDVKTSFSDMVKDNLFAVLAVIAGVMIIILGLLLRNIRSERKILEEERMLSTLNKRVFVDPLTSVRNKGAFSDYIETIQGRVDQDEQFDFAIGVFDCNDLKRINDRYGHDKGDEYLKAASHLICKVFQHSSVFRIGGDEFAVVLENDDFQNMDDLIHEFEEKQKEICTAAESEWDEVRVAVGIAVYDPVHDGSVNDTARRADKLKYANKAEGKKTRTY
jgi:diguanylate cyclase (GGDEF)-like protein